MAKIRSAEPTDLPACADLAVELIDPRRGRSFMEAALGRDQLLVATENGDMVGLMAYRTDWFNCTFVSLVAVASEHRRRGIARALFRAVEQRSPNPRLFSSTEETNAAAIRMHSALGFTVSGYIDNLPQGHRELLFYRRLPGRLGSEADRVSVFGDNGGTGRV